jgi:hypothetical protein
LHDLPARGYFTLSARQWSKDCSSEREVGAGRGVRFPGPKGRMTQRRSNVQRTVRRVWAHRDTDRGSRHQRSSLPPSSGGPRGAAPADLGVHHRVLPCRRLPGSARGPARAPDPFRRRDLDRLQRWDSRRLIQHILLLIDDEWTEGSPMAIGPSGPDELLRIPLRCDGRRTNPSVSQSARSTRSGT